MPQFPILYFLITIFVLSFLLDFFKVKKFFYIEIFVETSINKLIKSLITISTAYMQCVVF